VNGVPNDTDSVPARVQLHEFDTGGSWILCPCPARIGSDESDRLQGEGLLILFLLTRGSSDAYTRSVQ
jgi:hypothetical protein